MSYCSARILIFFLCGWSGASIGLSIPATLLLGVAVYIVLCLIESEASA